MCSVRSVTYVSGRSTSIGPEPCAGIREDVGEASAGESTGQPLSRERLIIPDADTVPNVEGDTDGRAIASAWTIRRGRRPWHVQELLVREPGEPRAGTKRNTSSFFDDVSQGWLVRFVEHRIGDPRIVSLIRKWLKAGILEDGVVTLSDKGTEQGSVISPLLANVYLHYVFDLWADRWRRREATGDVIIVRYADDIVVGFEREAMPEACFQHDARRFWDAMQNRFEEFALSLHPDKTRLIEFGRHAAARRAKAGLGKPETFNFLGFTVICGRSRAGKFLVKRKSRRDRMRTRLKDIKEELRRRRHQPIPEQGKWLAQVVRGYFAYHAVPTNSASIRAFRHYVVDLWRRSL
jgi:RNA-directed DNA polymerase